MAINVDLPIDISHDTIMDPVNIPSRYKLFQASSNNTGNIFATFQYNLFDGFRVSLRSLDSRLKLSYEPPNNSELYKLAKGPLKIFFSWYDTPRGPRSADIGIGLPKIFSVYSKKYQSAFQFGLSSGLRVHSLSKSILAPFINFNFTYFGQMGWINLNIPINRKSNRIVAKHHMFFSLLGTTLLSSLEVSTRLFSKSSKILFNKFIQNNNSRSTSSGNGGGLPMSPSSTNIPNLMNPYENSVIDTIHYKIVHIGSSTEFGVRRLNNIYGITKYQLEFGLKHQFTTYGALQAVYTYTIGENTNFGLSFGFNI
ncbi:hypothetical protein DLAC_04534 [Tieghemostelium lacteum]|uniref:Uncharacterized protein n=1 Tax=Tieghemostelium lacteum TaxID=361077 RepID=A0A151ZK30_TIELA|nr:hypothetical protein DLAC_04534 [Tieghemostelium lacteum]|eukprot:KYQ94240.1 hypothetical protein DLAC_04534 [Tieghemostelium lacteum]